MPESTFEERAARRGNPVCACGRAAIYFKTSECGRCFQRRKIAKPRYYDGGPCIRKSPNYNAAHNRIRYWRGSARLYMCVDCGGKADDWSYNGGSTYEQKGLAPDQRGVVRLVAYSGNPADYSPRCKIDHLRFDRDRDANA